MNNTRKFKVSKWIVMSLAILLNSFIIFYSCLSEDLTNTWNRSVTNFFTSLVNGFTSKEIKTIPLENIEANLSDEENYKYNYLLGYKVEEIPLGSAKQIECSFEPSDASNKAVSYSASPSDAVVLNQSGSTVSVVGMKTGECIITAKSSDGGFESVVRINIVDTIAPTSYEISLSNNCIPIGTTQTLNIDIDGGVLGHNELINFRYYDTRKLHYLSSNDNVAKVDQFGVIYPVSVGSATITVANDLGVSKSVEVNVSDGSSPALYSDLSISGSNVCYANDMILDQNSGKNHYQLTPMDGETKLNPEDFIWESSNDLLVRVDKHGILRGFRKPLLEDMEVTITAISKMTQQKCSYKVVLKEELPVDFYYKFSLGDEEVWNPKEYTFAVGEDVTISFFFSNRPNNKRVLLEISDNSVIDYTYEGEQVVLHILNEGECTVTYSPVANPDLKIVANYTVVKSGAISNKDISKVNKYIRKIIGHASLFAIAQVFTFLTFFMFFFERKWYVFTSMSLGEGLFISGVSELIQFLVPSRLGTFTDVLINFAGVVVGASLTLLGIFIVKKIRNKRKGVK